MSIIDFDLQKRAFCRIEVMEPSFFRASVILDMAIQIENHGIAFYRGCLQSSVGSKLKDVFNYLIDQEHKHIGTFSEMKKELSEDTLPEDYPGEIQSYINAFVKKEVFNSPAEAAQEAASLNSALEAVDFAIDFEKRSIRFYSEIQPRVRSSESEKIGKIIAEENKHIQNLNNLRKQLTE
jgi:rubrerythrin